jgi:hypothetical protein
MALERRFYEDTECAPVGEKLIMVSQNVEDLNYGQQIHEICSAIHVHSKKTWFVSFEAL